MSFVKSSDGRDVLPISIAGKKLALNECRLIAVRSAMQGRDVHFAQGASVEDARDAAEASYQTFLHWKETNWSRRRDILLKAADIVASREEAFVEMQVKETSCPVQWASFNVGLAAKVVREIATSISIEGTGELPAPDNPSAFCLVFKEPVGPVLAIEPWNASMILSARALAAPLGAGCTVVFKASELCPGVHHLLVQAFEDAQIPTGCINVLQARRQDSAEITEALIAHPAIRKIAFTGSANVGKLIGQAASRYLKPVLMELGGKAAAIVLKDANLQQAAKLCAQGAFLHHGQICMSTDRIIVVKEVADEFAEALKTCVAQCYQAGCGSAVSIGVAQRAKSLIDDAVKNGATYLVGNNEFRDATHAALVPTVIMGVKPEDSIFGEETFGPSASFYVVENEDEAVKLANATKYGLNAAVHSRDILAALKVARRIDCGQVHINTITEYDEPNAPIGGVKGSGWGRNNGRYALREFLVQKTISIHDADAAVNFGDH